MISKECFVYIHLPNSHEVVTAGRIEWKNNGVNSDVGTFVYGQNYLKNSKAFPLDPFELPLEQREFQVTKNEGVPGPIRDASPDSWGRYVIQKSTPASEHDPIGYLINSAGDRIGALSFGNGKVPPAPVRKFNKTVDLAKLIQAVHKLEQDLPLDETERGLLMIGPSAGGARPKTTVENGNKLWIAKFPAINDKQNMSRIEYATMKLAKQCGLNVPEVEIKKVGTPEVFLIKRFDREYDDATKNYFRTHFVSGLTLLNLDENDYSNWSYLDLADQMRRWIKNPKNDLKELFKRIIFNGLVSNTDDHPRNHGFLYSDRGYKLSPVYDLVPKPETGSERYLAMEIGDQGRVFNLDNVLSRCDAFDLKKEEAAEIFEGMQQRIAKWSQLFSALEVSPSDMKYLDSAFGYWNINF